MTEGDCETYPMAFFLKTPYRSGIPGAATASTFIPWQAGPSPVPHWLSTMGLQSSRTSPSLTAYSFFSLPILSPYFSKEL